MKLPVDESSEGIVEIESGVIGDLMVISKGIEELDRGVVCLFLRDFIPDICLLVLNLLC